MNWRQSAACRDEDPELFFPIGVSGPATTQQAESAKAVCGRCRVRKHCLEWALEHHQDSGIWGGLDESERRSMSRRTARARR
ncbi:MULTISPECIES: WhiB family transcriptional regulator [unclassified Streptomyces]|uniref:WhiB family transcriptional regulator n=1 Tax=unclassified Streptomyces TaxID=2593676 RepID=UPI003FD335BA